MCNQIIVAIACLPHQQIGVLFQVLFTLAANMFAGLPLPKHWDHLMILDM
jgi:hypothetical protein